MRKTRIRPTHTLLDNTKSIRVKTTGYEYLLDKNIIELF